MKKMKYIYIVLLVSLSTACSNWLDILPENQQSSDEYWKTKEQVASVVASGYSYFRKMVTDCSLFDLGELRAGCVYNTKGTDMQTFQMSATDKKASWASFYKVINMANSVLANAEGVMSVDQTFNEAVMKSYLVEAYFQRALCYFYLVRNWKEVPLILEPYTTDEVSFHKAKSTEAEVIAQIKADIKAALATGAAKETYSKDWQNKGRATKWALYALMSDVCLWSQDYNEAVAYSNYILSDTSSAFCPKFMSNNSQNTWFQLFNPGNSNESIFEVQYSEDDKQANEFATKYFGTNNPVYQYSRPMLSDLTEEVDESGVAQAVRTIYGAYYPNTTEEDYLRATIGYIWKYTGDQAGNQRNASGRPSGQRDPNFIIYRVAEIMLIKAEALTMLGNAHYDEVLELINKIRKRSNLPALEGSGNMYSEQQLLTAILHERRMELAAEGKIWYDILRMGRLNSNYKQMLLVEQVTKYNRTANSAWIRTALKDDNALYLPIASSEIDNNPLLHQNPYYE